MSLTERIVSLPYEASLVEWAGLFAHLPGFAYLDSGDQTGGTERELLTALPSARHTLQHYSGEGAGSTGGNRSSARSRPPLG